MEMPLCVHAVRDDDPPVSERGGEAIRVRGLVQGVGFRPAVWRLAHDCGVSGTVCNDTEGVLIHAWADMPVLDRFVAGLHGRCPPLGRIDSVERRAVSDSVAIARRIQDRCERRWSCTYRRGARRGDLPGLS